jgi:hypothetical protein
MCPPFFYLWLIRALRAILFSFRAERARSTREAKEQVTIGG